MKNNHIDSDAREMIKDWERKEPQIRIDIEEYKEKKEIAYLLKLARMNAGISQVELSRKTKVPSSVISRNVYNSDSYGMPVNTNQNRGTRRSTLRLYNIRAPYAGQGGFI